MTNPPDNILKDIHQSFFGMEKGIRLRGKYSQTVTRMVV